MSVLKNIKDRLVMFIIGVISTAGSLVLLYWDLFRKKGQWYTDNMNYSIPMFFIGITLVCLAFAKKKAEPDNKVTNSNVNNTDEKIQ
jgi:hypothetical protein